MKCESCGQELHEIDNIIGRWCDPDCAEKGAECALCGLAPHRCRCSPEDLQAVEDDRPDPRDMDPGYGGTL